MSTANTQMIVESLRRLSFSGSLSGDQERAVGSVDGSLDGSQHSRHSVKLGSASAKDDLDHINRSLEHVNNYSKRRLAEKLPPVLMYEITSTGESCYKSITLRELLNDVNDEALAVDEGAFLHFVNGVNQRRSQSAPATLQEEKLSSVDGSGHYSTKMGNQQPGGVGTSFEPINIQPRRSIQYPIGATKSIYEARYGPTSVSNTGTSRPPSPSPADDTIEVSYDATGILRLRDLRRLDFQFNPNEERSVLIRRHAVLFAMDPIRAVVMANRLILIVPDGADSLLSILDQYMKEWVSGKEKSLQKENRHAGEHGGHGGHAGEHHERHGEHDHSASVASTEAFTPHSSTDIHPASRSHSGTNLLAMGKKFLGIAPGTKAHSVPPRGATFGVELADLSPGVAPEGVDASLPVPPPPPPPFGSPSQMSDGGALSDEDVISARKALSSSGSGANLLTMGKRFMKRGAAKTVAPGPPGEALNPPVDMEAPAATYTGAASTAATGVGPGADAGADAGGDAGGGAGSGAGAMGPKVVVGASTGGADVITARRSSTNPGSGGSGTNLLAMGKKLIKLGTTTTSAPGQPSAGANAGTTTGPPLSMVGSDNTSTPNGHSTSNPPTGSEPQRLRTDYEKQRLASASVHSQDLPFELHAFEALLTTVMALETLEFNKINAQVQIILNYFRSGSLLPIEVQEKMRMRKNDLSVMIRRIISARNTINQVTEEDEQMALMNLTVLRDKPSLYHYPLGPEILSKHDDVEEMLESYLIDFSALESKIELARNQIQNAEELLFLRLDTSRNELLIANTWLAILAAVFGLGAFVSGVFGMNLDNTGKLQSTKYVFYTTIAVTTGAMILMFCGMYYMFQRSGMFPAKISLDAKDKARLRMST